MTSLHVAAAGPEGLAMFVHVVALAKVGLMIEAVGLAFHFRSNCYHIADNPTRWTISSVAAVARVDIERRKRSRGDRHLRSVGSREAMSSHQVDWVPKHLPRAPVTENDHGAS